MHSDDVSERNLNF